MIKKELVILESLGNGRTIADAARECEVDYRTVKKVISKYNLTPTAKDTKVSYSVRLPRDVSIMMCEAVRNTNETISQLLNAVILSGLRDRVR